MISVFSDIPCTPTIRTLIWWYIADSLRRIALAVAETAINFAGLITILVLSATSYFSRSNSIARAARQCLDRNASPLRRQRRRAGATTDASGRDANAGVVGAMRYLAAGQADMFEMDCQVRDFERMFMSPLGRFITWFAEFFPLVATGTLQYEGGILATRTVVLDDMINCFLGCDTRNSGVKRPVPSNSDVTTDGSATASTPTSPRSTETTADDAIRRQVLILGAGFDSRAYRLPAIVNPARNSAVSVIEVDQASVQRVKLLRLRAGLGEKRFKELTSRVDYVSVNFAHDGALKKALESSRLFDPNLPTFVLWEGVTYYLPLAAVHATLSALTELRNAAVAPAEWTLAFDFTDDEAFFDPLRVFQHLNWAALGILNHPCQSSLPFYKPQLQKELNAHDLVVDDVWRGEELIGKLFPHIGTARNMLGIHIAQCRWKSVLATTTATRCNC